MVDPWRHLNDWKKPSNKADSELESFFQEARTKTDFATAKRVILRGKTTEVIDQITDGELDFAYIYADHTLKGIAIDLIRVYPKSAQRRLSGWRRLYKVGMGTQHSIRAEAGIPVCRDILRKPSAPPSTRCRTRSSVSRKRGPHNSLLSRYHRPL